MATSAENTRKRQYQPSINSYFQRNGSKIAELGSLPNQISPMSPPLPAETQSSLLTVGMRVRKSVPEGYKTHKTMPTEEFPFPSTALANAAVLRPAYTTTNSRELAPFCGLHKIGGLYSQGSLDAPPSSAPPTFPTVRDSGSSMPGLSMSQNTVPSTQGSIMSNAAPELSNKRSYEEDIEQDLDAYFDEVEAEEQMTPVELYTRTSPTVCLCGVFFNLAILRPSIGATCSSASTSSKYASRSSSMSSSYERL